MLTPRESAELRALQVKAYGRGEGISVVDGARLRELEERRRSAGASATAADAGAAGPRVLTDRGSLAADHGSQETANDDRRAGRRELDLLADDAEASGVEASDAEAPARQRRRVRWRHAAASALVLALGVGIGWMLFGWNSAEFALAVSHADTRAEIEASGDYDPGSVVALGEDYGAVVWLAQQDNGESECVILTVDEKQGQACQPVESVEPNGALSVSLFDTDDAGSGINVVASVVRSSTGELTPIIQTWSLEYDWKSQYTATELEIIDRIEEAGFDGESLILVGYDGESPVWQAYHQAGSCVLADSDDGIATACSETAGEDLTLTVSAHGTSTDYVVRDTNRGPVLTIVKLPEVVHVESGTQIEVDDKTGDVLDLTFEDPAHDSDGG